MKNILVAVLGMLGASGLAMASGDIAPANEIPPTMETLVLLSAGGAIVLMLIFGLKR